MLGKQRFRASIERLSTNDLWLLEHMVIAFWHTFGISNGLSINPATDLQTVQYKQGPDGHYVSAQTMRAKLDEYITWLERYQASWGTARYDQIFPAETLLQELFQTGHAHWDKVVKMIGLLQIGVIPACVPWSDQAKFAPLVALLQEAGTDKSRIEITRDDEGIVHVMYQEKEVFAAGEDEFVDAFFFLFGIENNHVPLKQE
jgi:hypothetical protein